MRNSSTTMEPDQHFSMESLFTDSLETDWSQRPPRDENEENRHSTIIRKNPWASQGVEEVLPDFDEYLLNRNTLHRRQRGDFPDSLEATDSLASLQDANGEVSTSPENKRDSSMPTADAGVAGRKADISKKPEVGDPKSSDSLRSRQEAAVVDKEGSNEKSRSQAESTDGKTLRGKELTGTAATLPGNSAKPSNEEQGQIQARDRLTKSKELPYELGEPDTETKQLSKDLTSAKTMPSGSKRGTGNKSGDGTPLSEKPPDEKGSQNFIRSRATAALSEKPPDEKGSQSSIRSRATAALSEKPPDEKGSQNSIRSLATAAEAEPRSASPKSYSSEKSKVPAGPQYSTRSKSAGEKPPQQEKTFSGTGIAPGRVASPNYVTDESHSPSSRHATVTNMKKLSDSGGPSSSSGVSQNSDALQGYLNSTNYGPRESRSPSSRYPTRPHVKKLDDSEGQSAVTSQGKANSLDTISGKPPSGFSKDLMSPNKKSRVSWQDWCNISEPQLGQNRRHDPEQIHRYTRVPKSLVKADPNDAFRHLFKRSNTLASLRRIDRNFTFSSSNLQPSAPIKSKDPIHDKMRAAMYCYARRPLPRRAATCSQSCYDTRCQNMSLPQTSSLRNQLLCATSQSLARKQLMCCGFDQGLPKGTSPTSNAPSTPILCICKPSPGEQAPYRCMMIPFTVCCPACRQTLDAIVSPSQQKSFVPPALPPPSQGAPTPPPNRPLTANQTGQQSPALNPQNMNGVGNLSPTPGELYRQQVAAASCFFNNRQSDYLSMFGTPQPSAPLSPANTITSTGFTNPNKFGRNIRRIVVTTELRNIFL